MSISEPAKIPRPFAETGIKNPIPPAANNTTGKAGFDKGFPERTMLPKASGGIPPSGMDFNGILYDVTSAIRYMQAGGRPTYDAAFASAIGGYPSGAVLIGDDGSSVFQNTVTGNETDPNSGGAGWARPDLQVMELYRRSYADLGLLLIGSFKDGVTLSSPRDVVLDENSGLAYSWAGAYPPGGYVVDPGTSPTSSALFVQRSHLKSSYASVQLMFAEAKTAFFVGQQLRTGGTTWVFEDTASPITKDNFRAFGALCALDWGVRPNDPTFDNSVIIQEIIDYAETKVVGKSGHDSRGGLEIAFTEGTYRVDHMMRVGESNIGIVGHGGVTFDTSNWVSRITDPAVFLIGSAENWLNTTTISTTTKYNYLENVKFSRSAGQSPIGVMLSGTRNAYISRVLVERLWCGLWCENTSELTSHQFSSIGCNYGIIGDARKTRSVGSSPLGIANVDNDFSANTFNGTTIYYPQHTGILLINSGTTSFYGATIGRFSENPSSGVDLRYGLPGKSAGVHYWGGNMNFTKAGIIEDFVYEPEPTSSKTCILMTSEAINNPIRGLTLNSQHVQTYAADYVNGNVTTLLQVESYNGGGIDATVLRDSGFTFATTGFMYPPLVKQTSDASVGSTVSNMSVKIENCYPTVSLSTSDIGASVVNNIEYIERTNTELNREASGAPAGWTLSAGSNIQNLGGSSGEEGYIRLAGNGGNISYIHKNFMYRYYQSKIGAVYLSLWYRGDTAPHINFLVNGVADTARVIKSGANRARYSNALEDFVVSSKWKRAVYMFKPFSANYPLDTLRIELGRASNGGTNYTEFKGIEVGFGTLIEEPYNTF